MLSTWVFDTSLNNIGHDFMKRFLAKPCSWWQLSYLSWERKAEWVHANVELISDLWWQRASPYLLFLSKKLFFFFSFFSVIIWISAATLEFSYIYCFVFHYFLHGCYLWLYKTLSRSLWFWQHSIPHRAKTAGYNDAWSCSYICNSHLSCKYDYCPLLCFLCKSLFVALPFHPFISLWN